MPHPAMHIGDTPGFEPIAAEITSETELVDDYVQFHSDLGRAVGNSDLVDIVPGGKIVYAKRLNRDNTQSSAYQNLPSHYHS